MKKYIKSWFKSFNIMISIPGYILGIYGITDVFVDDKKSRYIVAVVIVIASIIVSFVLLLINVLVDRKREEIITNENLVTRTLREAFETWNRNEQYGNVITFGRTFGRALYISAHYDTRIEIGKLVKDAAVKYNDTDLEIRILLDDLGWTKFLCGKENDAVKDINKGIELAKNSSNYELISKGYRHLAAIAITKGNLKKADNYIEEAFYAYDKMEEGSEKKKTFSGLLYASAELLLKKGDYKQAMDKAIESKKKRLELNVLDRSMRSCAQIGKIELLNPDGNLCKARNSFAEGLEESESINRIDELVKNAYGYAICSIKLGERKRGINRTRRIIKKYGNIPLYSEDDILRKEYNMLKENIKREEEKYGIH